MGLQSILYLGTVFTGPHLEQDIFCFFPVSEISGYGTSFDGDTLKQCIGLESPKNGRIKNLVFEETYTPGHEITFECFDQYELIGTSKLTCMDNGNWSHPAPSCNRKYELINCN